MPFDPRHLSVLANANGFTLWHLMSSEDDVDTISGPSYLAKAGGICSVGDLIMVAGFDGARILSVTHSHPGTLITAPLR